MHVRNYHTGSHKMKCGARAKLGVASRHRSGYARNRGRYARNTFLHAYKNRIEVPEQDIVKASWRERLRCAVRLRHGIHILSMFERPQDRAVSERVRAGSCKLGCLSAFLLRETLLLHFPCSFGSQVFSSYSRHRHPRKIDYDPQRRIFKKC